MDSARNEIVQANAESVGKSPEGVNGAGSATRFNVNELDVAGAGGAGQGGLREAATFAPDLKRRFAGDQPVGDRRRNELLLPGIDSRLNSERGLDVGQILIDGAQALILGFRDRHGVSHGSLALAGKPRADQPVHDDAFLGDPNSKGTRGRGTTSTKRSSSLGARQLYETAQSLCDQVTHLRGYLLSRRL